MLSALRRLAVISAATVALPVVLAAPAAAESVSITTSTAQISRSDQRFVSVQGEAICPAGEDRFVRVTVSQQRTVGGDAAGLACTGGPSGWSVRVQTGGSAPWRPGNATVVARMFTSDGEEMASRAIRVRLVR